MEEGKNAELPALDKPFRIRVDKADGGRLLMFGSTRLGKCPGATFQLFGVQGKPELDPGNATGPDIAAEGLRR